MWWRERRCAVAEIGAPGGGGGGGGDDHDRPWS